MPALHAHQEHKATLSRSDRIMIWLVEGVVATVAFVVFCLALAFAPVVQPSLLLTVTFISSGVLQLVLLPVIMIYQRIQSRHDALQSEANYRAAQHAERELARVNAKLDALLKKMGVP